ncbi:ABC transporter ATP-binding protein [Kaistia defluvii]|uniref:ABC transporter ATP-binding protein n=1 Tax=Kaistia defluvii TaxID=410841 RepID=UPI00225A8BDF|nr:ABC transporter ATP-binding protein [Kaistia defluvii]MCX5517679.1 ABC transporter ATP-binding protein [Kaistia defluvii]
MSTIELEARSIVKRYGPLVANDHIDLSVLSGEVHAVMGENGAGKSTLMSILYGMQAPDSGQIFLRGAEMRYRSALDAIGAGMGMVHQAFKLFNSLTVWENVVYGMEPTRFGFIDRREAARRVAALADRYRLQVDPNAVVGQLSVGVRQRVEILKALYRDARVLILDEPTAVLTPQERDGLFDIIRNLTADDRTILFVTHKLHEVMAITDRVTVLRDGKVVDRMVTSETSAREIIRAMTGRAVNLTVEKRPSEPGAVVLEARGLTVATDGGKPVVDRVDLAIRAGEIVGIAGVAGNGQTELIEALTGLRIPDGGKVAINGADVTALDVERHRDAGLAYIPEDRATTGTALAASAADNLAMGFQRKPPLSNGRLLDAGAVTAHAKKLIDRFGVKIGSEQLAVGTLSGGNLQKVVVARELSHAAPLLIAEQPTRGVDVGAIEFIHAQLVAERDRGGAVLLVSAELTEILALSDRVLVMFDGRILAELPAAEADEETLGLLMAGRVGEAHLSDGTEAA